MSRSKKHDPRNWRKWIESGAVDGVQGIGSGDYYLIKCAKPVTPAEIVEHFKKVGLQPLMVSEAEALFGRPFGLGIQRAKKLFDPQFAFLSFREC